MIQQKTEKPPYKIPTIEEIRSIPWNGLTVASTFSGAGGSCTGYRMAGYRVVWANEFVPIAQQSYKANASEHCFLDPRDIKLIQAEDILKVTGLKKGELDLFDGSPPCQAFSTAGKREKGWGKKKKYEHGAEQCNEQLFGEYIRLLRGLMPRTFVAENVSGLVKGTAKGMFLEILRDLKASGYRVGCKVLDAKWLGVPQSRTRTIFVGVREDLNLDPVHPKPLPYFYSVRDALPWIIKVTLDSKGKFSVEINDGNRPNNTITCTNKNHLEVEAVEPETDISRYAIGDEWDKLKPEESSNKYFSLSKPSPDLPCPTITAAGGCTSIAGVVHPTIKRKFTISEIKRICSFPDDFILKGSYAQQWERLGNSVPPLMMKAIAEEIRDRILLKTKREADHG